MSRSTIVGIYPGEKITKVLELQNSWGTAPVVWEAMASRYLGVTKPYGHPELGWMQLGDELWNLSLRPDIPVEHRMVFMFTFDRAYVAKKDYGRMAAAIDQFLKDFPPRPLHANHWQAIRDLFISDPDIPGLGLWATSVTDNPFKGEWNDDAEEYGPPPWDKIYDLADELDKPA